MEDLTAARIQYLVTDDHYLEQMTVEKGGRLVRWPFAFRALVVPSTFILPLGSMKKIAAFAAAGGTVYLLGEPPRGSTEFGLNDPRMEELVERLSDLPTVHRAPEGVAHLVAQGAKHLRPQVEFLSGGFALLDLHRRIDGRDFYWLANNTGARQDGLLAFRGAKGAAFAWDCETGTVTALASKQGVGTSRVRVAFDPYQAFWLVFDPARAPRAAGGTRKEPRAVRIPVEGTWRVCFDPAIQPPPVSPGVTPDVPQAFTAEGGSEQTLAAWSDWGLGEFSGFLDYRTTFTLDAAGGRVVLDLGEVRHMAEVRINGKSAGARLWPPFAFDVTALVRPGKNELTVRVGNLLCNAMRRFGTWGWTRPGPEEFRSGLFGPVTIIQE
jgi:hypothetical protein